MALLTKEQILSVDDIKTEIVKVPEWGGELKIAMMTGHNRDKYEESCVGKNGTPNLNNIRAKLAAHSIVGEDGQRLFSDGDIAKLGKKSGVALVRVYDAIQRLNKITEADLDELAKN